ncbi:hypothetical protein FRC03_011473 [Tulasnella sp. 419]|nr:hypothetical protein FRC02_010790 [Tulasnella sp. 418]KAG8954521.1 hypothetical protein FRC03_011473 [Tulasnella sp. 419]
MLLPIAINTVPGLVHRLQQPAVQPLLSFFDWRSSSLYLMYLQKLKIALVEDLDRADLLPPLDPLKNTPIDGFFQSLDLFNAPYSIPPRGKSPISRIPNEVLSSILIYAQPEDAIEVQSILEEDFIYNRYIAHRDFYNRITLVSKRFKAVLESTPQLWVNVNVMDYDRHALSYPRRQIPRSGTLPLSIRLHAKWSNVLVLQRDILPQCDRCQEMFIDYSVFNSVDTLGMPCAWVLHLRPSLPRLKTLWIVGPYESPGPGSLPVDASEDVQFPFDAPNLQSLYTDVSFTYFPNNSFPPLTSLTLANLACVDVESVLSYIENFKDTLQKLSMVHLDYQSQIQRGGRRRRLVMPHLQEVQLYYGDHLAWGVVARVYGPAVTKLEVTGTSRSRFAGVNPVESFPNLSELTWKSDTNSMGSMNNIDTPRFLLPFFKTMPTLKVITTGSLLEDEMAAPACSSLFELMVVIPQHVRCNMNVMPMPHDAKAVSTFFRGVSNLVIRNFWPEQIEVIVLTHAANLKSVTIMDPWSVRGRHELQVLYWRQIIQNLRRIVPIQFVMTEVPSLTELPASLRWWLDN